jgi:hypothetical protein
MPRLGPWLHTVQQHPWSAKAAIVMSRLRLRFFGQRVAAEAQTGDSRAHLQLRVRMTPPKGRQIEIEARLMPSREKWQVL